jgi:Transposase DDE domain
VVIGDKGYDSEENHVLVRELLHGFSIIPTRYEHVPIWRTHGRYRKQMKHGYSKVLYNQRNKDETIVSVIKRLFGEHLMSRLIRTQNRELSFRCIAYNTHRLANLTIIKWFLRSLNCQFTTRYYDYEIGKKVDFHCDDEEPLASGFCIFHDKDYLQVPCCINHYYIGMV